jgi:hypothetical protein
MKKLAAFTFTALLATQAAAQQAPLKPDDFAWRCAITIYGVGPFHQTALPPEVYKGLVSADLADLRVFNGQGEALPYALLRSKTQAVSQTTESAAPFFPVVSAAASGAASSGAGDVAVTVRQNADGTLVSVRQSPAKTAAEPGDMVKGVVVDASAVKGGVRSLRLVTGPSPEPFHSYTIESSKDLQQWRVLKYDAQLAHLEHAGHRVDNDSVEWDSAADRYLRLIWQNPQRAPEIKSVLLGAVETSFVPPARVWSEAIAPPVAQSGVYEYILPGQMPLEKLRINLPQVNTLAPIDIDYLTRRPRAARPGQYRREEAQHWENLAHAVAYRLQAPQGEVRSADITVYGAASNRLRLTVDARSGGVGATPPSIQIGFEPHVLVFLARGSGPFVLAWGAGGVAPADLSASTLVPGYNGSAPLNAAPASLAPSDIIQVKRLPQADKAGPDAASGASKWVLWGVLLVGLLVLGGMARSLTKQLRQPPK